MLILTTEEKRAYTQLVREGLELDSIIKAIDDMGEYKLRQLRTLIQETLDEYRANKDNIRTTVYEKQLKTAIILIDQELNTLDIFKAFTTDVVDEYVVVNLMDKIEEELINNGYSNIDVDKLYERVSSLVLQLTIGSIDEFELFNSVV